MAKATRRSVLARIMGRAVKETPVCDGPVINHVIPDAELPVQNTVDFLLLQRTIDAADGVGVKANTRQAAIRGMDVLAEADPERMRAIIREGGAFGAAALKAAIMELAGYGRTVHA